MNEFKAEVSVEKTYTFTIKGKSYCGFKKESQWEGFAKFVDGKGQTVIAFGDGEIINVFKRLQDKPSECSLVVCPSEWISS
jgi:hypothetical protein